MPIPTQTPTPPPEPDASPATPAIRRPEARVLLALGALAGPFVLVAGAVQAWARPGVHRHHHAPSLLALGEYGWVQTSNFVVAGCLVLALALGAWRALRGQPGGTWVPRLLALFGACHVLVGLGRTNPAFDFPPGGGSAGADGAPVPAEAGLSATLHSLFGFLAFNVLAATAFVLARHFRGRRQAGWVVASVALGVAVLGLDAYVAAWEFRRRAGAETPFDFRPLWALLPLAWGYLTALALSLRRRLA